MHLYFNQFTETNVKAQNELRVACAWTRCFIIFIPGSLHNVHVYLRNKILEMGFCSLYTRLTSTLNCCNMDKPPVASKPWCHPVLSSSPGVSPFSQPALASPGVTPSSHPALVSARLLIQSWCQPVFSSSPGVKPWPVPRLFSQLLWPVPVLWARPDWLATVELSFNVVYILPCTTKARQKLKSVFFYDIIDINVWWLT